MRWLPVIAATILAATPGRAAVVIVENTTTQNVDFAIQQSQGGETRHRALAGDLLPIPVTGDATLRFAAGGQPRRYAVEPNSIYFFAQQNKSLDLVEQILPEVARERGRTPSSDSNSSPSAACFTVPVKILADDSEPRVRAVWEKRLRERVAAASEIFERVCRVRLEVVAVDTWSSDRNIRDFNESIAEFERKVRPAPAQLAIGFTGRYQYNPGERHVGGIRGPLHPHILIREALNKVSEPERLEFLVHELGHYLGASHAPGDTSVMRPTLGDRRACVRTFRIGFDAPNAMAMYLLGEQLRRRPIASLYEMPADAKASLRRVYASLAKAMPDDPASPKYLLLLDIPLPFGATGAQR